jgi:hypothetical protein
MLVRMADREIGAEGWYLDPFGSHETRWFSDGKPTALVRDGDVESHDPPPAGAAGSSTHPEEIPAEGAADGADLIRAGDEPARSPGDAAFEAEFESGPGG